MAKGKYSSVIGKLEKEAPADPSWQERVEEAKKEILDGATPVPESLGKEYAKWRRVKADIQDELSVINLKLEALEQLLIDSQDQDVPGWGLYGAQPNAMRLANGSVIAVNWEPHAKVEDPAVFRQWCVDNGLEMSLRLMPMTTESIARERLLAGLAPPDGVAVKARPKISFTGK